MNLSRLPILRLAVAGALLSALVVLACGSEPTPSPAPTATLVPPPTVTPVPTPTLEPTPTPEPAPARETFIPEGANLVLDARPDALLDSRLLAPLMDEMLREFESETGISVASLDFAEFFVDLNEALEASLSMEGGEDVGVPAMGAILHGDIDEERVWPG